MKRALIITILLLGIGAFALWLGFRFPEPPHPNVGRSQLDERTFVYDGLPPGLQYYLVQTVSRTPYITTTALVWGTGSILLDLGPLSVWLPLRWTEAIDVKRGYVWTAEVMWWRWPLLKAADRWVDGRGLIRLGEHVMSSPWVRRGQAMRAKAEYAWLPSAFLTDPEIVWTTRSAWTAVMRFPVADARLDTAKGKETSVFRRGPAGIASDSLVASFDKRTRALVSLVGTRYRNDSTASAWSLSFTEWNDPGGLTVPVSGVAAREGKPYYTFDVIGMRYNVNVGKWMNRSGTDRTPAR